LFFCFSQCFFCFFVFLVFSMFFVFFCFSSHSGHCLSTKQCVATAEQCAWGLRVWLWSHLQATLPSDNLCLLYLQGLFAKTFTQRVTDIWFACNNVKMFAQRVLDRWYVWNQCLEIYSKNTDTWFACILC
jgi:hypothetical protein